MPSTSPPSALRCSCAWVALALLVCLGGCRSSAPSSGEPPDPQARPPGRTVLLEDASRRIERLERRGRGFDPSEDLTFELANAYFERAQRALEAGDQGTYVSDLARAQGHLLDAMERNPRRTAAHNQLAIVSAYRGDLPAARRGFEIAARLDPSSAVERLNLAEVAVYEGRLPEARAQLAKARRLGSPAAEIELVEVLAAWKNGDLIDARDRFRAARDMDSETVRTWNGASRIRTFEDFAVHCCRLAFCGPYLRNACQDVNLAVAEQKRTEETILEELRLEMEQVRRVREIYRERGIDIRVEEESDTAPSPEPQDSPGTP